MKKKVLWVIPVVSLVLLCGCKSAEDVKLGARQKIEDAMGKAVVGEIVEYPSISADCYAYQQLSHEERLVYDQMLHCILAQDERVALSTKDSTILQKVYDCVLADYASLFWISGFKYNTHVAWNRVVGIEFEPQYVYTKEEREELQEKIDAVVEEWLVGIGPNDSDYAKSRYVFETLIKNVDYVEGSASNQTILSVFLNGQTVCQGYASATQYLLRKLGIESTVIRGYANNDVHAWNLVLLDGEYYFTDTTWGNGRVLMPDNTIQSVIDYQYLNGTSDDFASTHLIEMPIPVPECNSKKLQ